MAVRAVLAIMKTASLGIAGQLESRLVGLDNLLAITLRRCLENPGGTGGDGGVRMFYQLVALTRVQVTGWYLALL